LILSTALSCNKGKKTLLRLDLGSPEAALAHFGVAALVSIPLLINETKDIQQRDYHDFYVSYI